MKQMVSLVPIMLIALLVGCSSSRVASQSKATVSPAGERGQYDCATVVEDVPDPQCPTMLCAPSIRLGKGEEARITLGEESEFISGNAAFRAGLAGIHVVFPQRLATDKYAVIVQPTNTSGYSPEQHGTYFNPLKKTATGFQVQHKRTSDGQPVKLDANVSLNWIVLPYSN